MDKPKKVKLPSTGVHVLPVMTAPAILAKRSEPRFLVVELTPIEGGSPTDARCHIPLTQDDAMRLALLIAEHGEKFASLHVQIKVFDHEDFPVVTFLDIFEANQDIVRR